MVVEEKEITLFGVFKGNHLCPDTKNKTCNTLIAKGYRFFIYVKVHALYSFSFSKTDLVFGMQIVKPISDFFCLLRYR